MFATPLQPIDNYRHIGTVTAVSQASPHQLVMLLFDGAIAAILQARHALSTGDIPTKVNTLSKAMRIIDEGLKASLESEVAPALADNLRALYDHMVSRLFIANLHNSDVPLADFRVQERVRVRFNEIDGQNIGFNANYLKDILGQIDSDTVELHLADAGAPTLIRENEGSRALYVLMPMRV